jgi:lipase
MERPVTVDGDRATGAADAVADAGARAGAAAGAPRHPYRTMDVPVSGGALRVGIWDAVGPHTADVLLVHGITSSHLAWPFVVDALPDGMRAIAPDLRGRGASRDVRGPAGMAAHADDLAAVLDALGIGSSPVVGHSMGAFVSVVLAARHPERVSRLLLVDGGLPLDVPPGLTPDEVVQSVLGATADRLHMRFADVAEYLAFWRAHPAFAADWSEPLERYLAYDLVPEGDALRPATSYATTVEDTIDLNTGTAIGDALARLAHPAVLLTAPRGLRDEQPGLYEEGHLAGLLARHPGIRHERVPGVNHYTIVLAPEGAARVAALAAG